MHNVGGKEIIQQEPEMPHIMIERTGPGAANEIMITT